MKLRDTPINSLFMHGCRQAFYLPFCKTPWLSKLQGVSKIVNKSEKNSSVLTSDELLVDRENVNLEFDISFVNIS